METMSSGEPQGSGGLASAATPGPPGFEQARPTSKMPIRSGLICLFPSFIGQRQQVTEAC